MTEFLQQVETPALVIDLDIMERNIRTTAQLVQQRGVELRPHAKTHKSPWIAKQQIDAGAVGITVAKLGEAEVMVAAGITDVLIAYPLVGHTKLSRLEALLQKANIAVSLDSVEVARGISDVGERVGRKVPVYLEVDTGLQRVGLPPERCADLAKSVAAFPGLDIAGMMTHGGHVGRAESAIALEKSAREQAAAVVRSAELVRREGIPVRVVSSGSTLTTRFDVDTKGVTEVRPGTYVFCDANTVRKWSAAEGDCAASVVATVVSRPAPGRVVIDAGSKTLSSDRSVAGEAGGLGRVRELPRASITQLTEEHGVITLPESGTQVRVGDRLTIIPNHICPVVNLSDAMYGVRKGRLEKEIPVVARGKRT